MIKSQFHPIKQNPPCPFVVNPSPIPTPGDHPSALFPYNFAISMMSYKWNPTGCSLLGLLSSPAFKSRRRRKVGKANVPLIRKKPLPKKPHVRNLLSSHWPTLRPTGTGGLARDCRHHVSIYLAFPTSEVEEAKDGDRNGCWLSQPEKSAA